MSGDVGEAARVLETRVAFGCACLDEIYPEHAWRAEAMRRASGPGRYSLRECAQAIAHASGARGDHEWHLAHGWTIDYSALGYPADDGGTPRPWRERRAYAELEAAWWRALAP